jgi:ferric-dicitrate binding protein FerR (iron transport regulator)
VTVHELCWKPEQDFEPGESAQFHAWCDATIAHVHAWCKAQYALMTAPAPEAGEAGATGLYCFCLIL